MIMINPPDKRDMLDEHQLAEILQKTGPRPAPPEHMARQVRSAIHETWQIEVEKSRKARKTQLAAGAGWLAIAASVVLLMTAGIVQLQSGAPTQIAVVDGSVNNVEVYAGGSWQPLKGNSVDESSRIRTGIDSYLSLTLINGMNVRLDEATEVFLDKPESLNLDKGRVYVDSYDYHAAGNRTTGNFLVNTSFGSASDIGTQFVVAAHQDGWRVQVREGAVLVRDDDIRTTVNIGSRVSISANDELTTSRVAPHDRSWQWAENVTPEFVLEGRSAAEYLQWVARETGRKVSFRSELARSEAESTILGGSTEGLQPGESLGVVLSSTDLVVVDDNSDSILIDMSLL
jgi:FecR protein